MKFLLDTNFLMIPGKFKIDIFRELKDFGKVYLYTLDSVVHELEKLSKGRGRDSRNARLAIHMIKKEGVRILHVEAKNTDEGIKKLAEKGYFTVCTADKELIKSLKGMGARIIYLRQGKYLVRD